MSDILEGKRGVNFKKVSSLITSKLGGTISEIGNGSSHKRIELQSYITEMVTQTGVVGGASRPHEKGHNPEKLSKFNLNLIKSVLVNAGITLEVVKDLEKKLEQRNARNSENPASFFSLPEFINTNIETKIAKDPRT